MNKQLLIAIAVIAVVVMGGGAYMYVNSAKSAGVKQAADAHEDGTAHVEGDTHQDETKPHADVTPHDVDESKPHLDATAHPIEAAKSTGSDRKPAAVDEAHIDAEPHAEDEPHN